MRRAREGLVATAVLAGALFCSPVAAQAATGPASGPPETVTAVDGTRFDVPSGQYTYDDNDRLLLGDRPASVEEFYAAVKVGSELEVIEYAADPSAVSVLRLAVPPGAAGARGESPEQLPRTGPEELAGAMTGAALVAAGWALVLATRMRNAGRHVRV